MAQYAILLFDTAGAGDYTPEQQRASQRHADELIESGVLSSAYALDSVETATSVRGDAVTERPVVGSLPPSTR